MLSAVSLLRMHKVRLREVNCNQDEQVRAIEPKRIRRRRTKAQLLAAIADLRQKSSTKMLKDSKRLIHQSRQLIFETEFDFIGDD